MTFIVAVANTKGGVGKSTNAVHFSAHFATKGRTLLIDADPQETAAGWATWRHQNASTKDRPKPRTVRLLGNAVYDEGQVLAKEHEFCVIDAGGRDSSSLRNALLLANLVVVPVGVSNFDSAAMSEFVTLLGDTKRFNQSMEVRGLLTRVDPRGREVGSMKQFLVETCGILVLNQMVAERVAFRRAAGEGMTVEEFGRDSNAIAEMSKVYEEITQ